MKILLTGLFFELSVNDLNMTEANTKPTISIKEGDIAPDFELTADDGRQVKLSDYRGKTVALYFYPMDNTPGCTTEAVDIRDAWREFVKRDVVVLGVSSDDVTSHRAFKECYELPFTLLSDPEHVVCDKYGTWGMDNKATRSTFLIAGSGRVLKIWALVDPAEHAKWLLKQLDEQLADI
ncbi:MAG: redoxin domain-containing protein [Gaiellaceae bacterium]